MNLAARFLSIVSCQLLIVLSLFSILYSLLTSSIYAAPGPPNPQPCKNPIETDFDELTDNYITDEDGKAPADLRWDGAKSLEVTGFPGESVDLPAVNFTFRVDFSKLESLFANTNSNYLEGKFQADEHRFLDILNLSSQDFNSFHGAGQKASPKLLVDEQKKNYVEYVYNKPTLAESNNKYTDIKGSGDPKTIYDLVNEFGLPNPPTSRSPESEIAAWQSTWGLYWEKIPTAYSEFYTGEIAFHYVLGNKGLETLKKNNICPLRAGDPITFVLPQFFRTTSVSDQLNRLVVAKEAQSYEPHGILAKAPINLLANTFRFCWEKILHSKETASSSLKKIIRISFNLINPIKTASAAEENKSCLRPLPEGKKGEAPYCPLPFSEANKPGVSCSNKNDPNKLEKDNPNVVCTFSRTFTAFVTIDPNSTPDKDPENAVFDSCEALAGGRYKCKVPLQIFPNIRIPWLAAIWNNTLYSDEGEHLDNQQTGRPGVFGFFTPNNIIKRTSLSGQEILDLCEATGGQDPICQELGKDFEACIAAGGTFGDCLTGILANLPANTKDAQVNDPKERFIGGVDCTKNFVKDLALKPKAVQEALGVNQDCGKP